MGTKFLTVPMILLRELNTSDAIILSYVHYRLRFNISFIESNEQIGKMVGLSECGVAKIMRKLKKEGYLGSLCKRHSEVILGCRNSIESQKTITKAYCRKSWLTKKGNEYFKK